MPNYLYYYQHSDEIPEPLNRNRKVHDIKKLSADIFQCMESSNKVVTLHLMSNFLVPHDIKIFPAV